MEVEMESNNNLGVDIDLILSNPIDFIDRAFELKKSKHQLKEFNPIKSFGNDAFKEIINSRKIKSLEEELHKFKSILKNENDKSDKNLEVENTNISDRTFVSIVNFTYVVTNTLNSDLYISHIEGDPYVDKSEKLTYAMLKYKSTNFSEIKEELISDICGREDSKVTVLERLEINVKPFSHLRDENTEDSEYEFTVYDYEKPSLKLNQIVKSIGVAYFLNNNVYFHSFHSQEVRVNNCFLSLSDLELFENSSEELKIDQSFLSKNRNMVKRFLSSKLLGEKFEFDNNLSELLILGICSEIFNRVSDVNIGNFTLNITGLLKKSDSIIELLKKYLPYVCIYKVTVNNLNNDKLIPTFNPDTEKLSSPPITYLEGGLVVLDETNLDTGKLSENGMTNFSFLTKTIDSQILTLDYPYNNGVDIPISSAFIIISEGGSIISKALKSVKSINFKDIKVLSENNLKEEFEQISEEDVKTYFKLLKYYTHPKFTKNFEISDEVSLKLQEYFVEQRKEKNFDSEEFSLFINLSKLRAISYGRNKLDYDLDFKYVTKL